MFNTNLRHRPSVANLISTVVSPPPRGLSLLESALPEHDLAVPIPNTNPQRTLRMLVLTPSSAADLPRIQRFASLTGGQDVAVVFHMDRSPTITSTASSASSVPRHPQQGSIGAAVNDGSEGEEPTQTSPLAAFHALEILLLDSALALPLIPLPRPAALPRLVSAFLRGVAQANAAGHGPRNAQQQSQANVPRGRGTGGLAIPTSAPVNAALDLLPWCSSEAPLRREHVHILSDLCPNLRSVAELAAWAGRAEGYRGRIRGEEEIGEGMSRREIERAARAWRLLSEYLGERAARGVVEFWEKETVVL
ncbi:hypothetical protein BDY21DRAFT_336635 [Lineolata rhizophorae]|uniref:Uncharacterized protein n=1 Tax=Lineolata rhizophorae TaxID=578093 RepID=A0A6A6P7A8_9PEZI|nr:hypothetical protein BDY21DRAFT_336635 [Lineolata rhizophorae]